MIRNYEEKERKHDGPSKLYDPIMRELEELKNFEVTKILLFENGSTFPWSSILSGYERALIKYEKKHNSFDTEYLKKLFNKYIDDEFKTKELLGLLCPWGAEYIKLFENEFLEIKKKYAKNDKINYLITELKKSIKQNREKFVCPELDQIITCSKEFLNNNITPHQFRSKIQIVWNLLIEKHYQFASLEDEALIILHSDVHEFGRPEVDLQFAVTEDVLRGTVMKLLPTFEKMAIKYNERKKEI